MSHTSANNTIIDPKDCTFETCSIEDSYFDYRPSLALNSLLIALFGLSVVLYLIQGIRYKTWSFLAVMLLGNIGEIIGYAGRVMGYNNPFTMDPFLIQICCLTFAPAFFAAGIYLCLSRIVIIFGADISRIPPKAYTWLFVTCDFISLVLQAAGGGIASVTSQDGESPTLGTNIMITGLAFQVFTLAMFMILCAEYALRVVRRKGSLDPTHAKLRASRKFRGFLCALALSTTFIMIRSVYRVIEMAQGWSGALMADETLFFILEGVMVVCAVGALNVFHPGWCFGEGYRVTEKGGEEESM
ncbi:uncharacterized protein LAJ45_09011 [Morchella importuna]|uniref:uncharacterized protein n=1 Tax=Morchella importuna TaxID=1174673 RepID=UPI001E8DEC80|nr:uncharacterized protein LAJ45_09011 [Morchella importuna]KAH8146931.1 hypothetical protein LAJ45_09011 [Morchella importuna]